MSTGLIVTLLLVAWCVVPLPLAVAVGRTFRDGQVPAPQEDVVRSYETAGA